jgi:hypothetical protein
MQIITGEKIMFAKNKVTQSMIDAVNQVLNEDEKKRLINDAEIDETGFHKAAHAAKRANQSHFEFQGKKYPVTAKSHKEAIEMDEASLKIATSTGTKVLGRGYGNSAKAHEVQHKNPFEKGPSKSDLKGIKAPTKKELKSIGEEDLSEAGDCVTEPQAKKIAKKEVSHHNVTMHKGKKSTMKEGSFASKLLTHIAENKAMGPTETFTDNNLGEEEMSDKQMKKREKIVLSMKKGEPGFKQRYGKNWKNVMYATATKQAMKEDSSDTWNGSYDFVISEKTEESVNEMDKTQSNPGGWNNDAYDLKKGKWKEAGKIASTKDMQDFALDSLTKKMKEPKVLGVLKRLSKEEVELDETNAEYKKNAGTKPMTDLIDPKKTVKAVEKGSKYFGSGVRKEESDLDEAKMSAAAKLMKSFDNAQKQSAAARRAGQELLGQTPKSQGLPFDPDKTSPFKNKNKNRTGVDIVKALSQKGMNREEVELDETVDVVQDKNSHKITTDMLSGRVPGGKLNSFKNFKVNLVTSGEEDIPKDVDKGTDTKEKQKVTTNPGPVDIKLDDKLTGPTPYTHFSDEKHVTSEDFRGQSNKLHKIRDDEHAKEIDQFNKKVKNLNKEEIGETPMSRAKELAKKSFKKIKNETMMGKISN